MGPADRKIRIVAALILAAGLAASGLAIFAGELGLGAEAARETFGWRQAILLLAGIVTVAVGAALLAWPRIASRLIDWEEMGSVELDVRIVAALVLLAGLAAAALAILAGVLGLSAGAPQGVFGWKRAALLLAGLIAIALGAAVLARPRIVSRLIRSPRIAAASDRGAIRRAMVAGGFVALIGAFGILGFAWLTDRLEASPATPPPAELTPLEQWRVEAEHICKIEHGFQLQAEIASAPRGAPASDHPHRLRAAASSILELHADLRQLGAPPEDVGAYRRLLASLGGVAAAYRAEAAAITEGGEGADERVRLANQRAADAEEENDLAAFELAAPSCGAEARFHAIAAASCERHHARLPTHDYTSAASDRPRLLRANASAMSTARRDLQRLDPPPADADQYSQLLESLSRLAAALRGAAAAVEEGDEARERAEIDRVSAAAEEGDLAADALEMSQCGL